jgi:predicted O-methyltransferase YrrM
MPSLRSRTRDAVVRGICSRSGLAAAVVRRAGSPRLYDMYRVASSWETASGPMLAAACRADTALVDDLVDEGRAILAALVERAATTTRRYPSDYAVEEETALFLYALVRLTQPNVAVETGVADGISTELMLAAMQQNGVGELHSIDIADDVGGLVSDRTRWTLHVVSPDGPEGCSGMIERLGRIDLFLHDGNHDRAYQAAEFAAAWEQLTPGGVLVSDDADWSYALLDFVAERGLAPVMLMDRRKVLGLVTKPAG